MATQDKVVKYRGCLALLFGDASPRRKQLEELLQSQSSRLHDENDRPLAMLPPSEWHVTLATKDELRTLSAEAVAEAKEQLSPRCFPIGLGGAATHPHVLFVVCVWPKAQAFRAKHNLPLKDFHVSVTADNSHVIDKFMTSLLDDQCHIQLDQTTLEVLCRQLLLESRPDRALQVATHLCCTYATSTTRGWARLADAAFAMDSFKLAMLSYARVLDLLGSAEDNPALIKYCHTKMAACSSHTEWGLVFRDEEFEQIPVELRPMLCRRWPTRVTSSIRPIARTAAPRLVTTSRERRQTLDTSRADALVEPLSLPRFFSWIVPFHLAVMSTPRNGADIEMLENSIGVQHVVTLTAEGPLPTEWFADGHSIANTFLPVDNYCAPTPAQIDMFIQACCSPPSSGSTPVLVHCGGGKGRAGTMVACYLVAFGFDRPPVDALANHDYQPVMSGSEAIHALRSVRPTSIETKEQEDAVQAYCSLLWKRRSLLPQAVQEPTSTFPEISGKSIEGTDLLMLCGLPGSGKSSFRTALRKRFAATVSARARTARPDGLWTEIDSDVSSRAACERSIGQSGQSKVIFDRCNGEAADRKIFLSLAATWSSHATAVWFDFPTALCEVRAMLRADHPTLPAGPRVHRAMAHHSRLFVPPDLAEGFQTVVRVTSIDAALALVDSLSPPLPLLKFPRTPHLIDLGAATEDDLVQAPEIADGISLVPGSTVISITEKIDGANLGISLSPSTRALVVQNRSHYVHSDSHRQFHGLDAFLARHREALHAILDRDPLFPGRFVLYGEWLAATHSIAYTRLRCIFYAFDLFDRETRQFWGRSRLEKLLDVCGAAIPLVPAMYTGSRLPSRAELVEMVQRPSELYDGRVEGVYIKWERDGQVKERSKVVRGDFLAGNEHWTKGAIKLNTVLDECR